MIVKIIVSDGVDQTCNVPLQVGFGRRYETSHPVPDMLTDHPILWVSCVRRV
jgi:hypothetical protein